MIIFESKRWDKAAGAILNFFFGWWIILALLVPESTEQRVRKKEEARARMREIYREDR